MLSIRSWKVVESNMFSARKQWQMQRGNLVQMPSQTTTSLEVTPFVKMSPTRLGFVRESRVVYPIKISNS